MGAGVCAVIAVAKHVAEEAGIQILEKIANDPPRSDFDNIVKLKPTPPFKSFDQSPFARAEAKYTTLLAEQKVLLEAVLITLERLQGAIGANSERFVLRQSEALVKFLHQLAKTQKRLQEATERMQSTFASFLSGDVEQKLTQLAASGFSAEERQLLQDAGLSAVDIQTLDQFVLSLPSDANFNNLVQQGLEQWGLVLADTESTVRAIAEIFEGLVFER